ncbi:MAG: hypothetical protein ACOC6Q_01030 [Patescibacteria group bacterium]
MSRKMLSKLRDTVGEIIGKGAPRNKNSLKLHLVKSENLLGKQEVVIRLAKKHTPESLPHPGLTRHHAVTAYYSSPGEGVFIQIDVPQKLFSHIPEETLAYLRLEIPDKVELTWEQRKFPWIGQKVQHTVGWNRRRGYYRTENLTHYFKI